MPLNDYFRFQAYNDSGESLDGGDIDIYVRFWKFDSNGALSWSTELNVYNGSSIGTTSYGTVIDAGSSETYYDNSSNKYLGFHGYAAVTTGTGTGDGVDIYIQFSPDGGTDFADDGSGVLLCHIDTPGASTYEEQIIY